MVGNRVLGVLHQLLRPFVGASAQTQNPELSLGPWGLLQSVLTAVRQRARKQHRFRRKLRNHCALFGLNGLGFRV